MINTGDEFGLPCYIPHAVNRDVMRFHRGADDSECCDFHALLAEDGGKWKVV